MYHERTVALAVLFGLAFTAALGHAPAFAQSSPNKAPQDHSAPGAQGNQGAEPPSSTGTPAVIKPPASGTMPVIKPPAAGVMPVIPPPADEQGKSGKPQ